MKNQKLIIFGGVVLVVVLVGGFFVLSSNKKTTVPQAETNPEQLEQPVVMMDPDEIGLTLTVTPDNRKVILEVTKTNGLSALDYELSYISKGDIPRGVIGHIDIKEGDKLIKKPLDLGTCSDVCHYDEDVSEIKVILKVTKADGTTAQVEKSL